MNLSRRVLACLTVLVLTAGGQYFRICYTAIEQGRPVGPSKPRSSTSWRTRLARELHPVAVYRWFTTPNPDLVPDPESEHGMSPRDWLRLGFSPRTAARLAADL